MLLWTTWPVASALCRPGAPTSARRRPGSVLSAVCGTLAARRGVEDVVLPVVVSDLHTLRAPHIDLVLCRPSSLTDQVQQCLRRGDQITVTIRPGLSQLRHQWRLPGLRGLLMLSQHQLGARPIAEPFLE